MLTLENIEDDKIVTMVYMQDFSEWIQDEMNKRDWSQSELARRAGISRVAIHNIFTEKRGAGPELCTAIAQAFNYPPDYVFRMAGLLPPEIEETLDQKELVYLFNLANAEQKQIILDYARFIVEKS